MPGSVASGFNGQKSDYKKLDLPTQSEKEPDFFNLSFLTTT